MNIKHYPNRVLLISSPSTHELYRIKMKVKKHFLAMPQVSSF